MSRYVTKKSYSWSGKLAYLAGLISSDGCLIDDNRHLSITSKDIEIIYYCQQILGKSNLKVQVKNGFNGSVAYCWQFSDVTLYDFFINAGLSTRKSKTIERVEVPARYWGDFLRGIFDGDGTTYAYYDKRWKNSYLYYLGISSASNAFLRWLHIQNRSIIGVYGGSIRNNTRAKTLVYAKKDTLKIYKAIYGSKTTADLYSLQRKRKKLTEFISNDNSNDDMIKLTSLSAGGEIGKHATLRW